MQGKGLGNKAVLRKPTGMSDRIIIKRLKKLGKKGIRAYKMGGSQLQINMCSMILLWK